MGTIRGRKLAAGRVGAAALGLVAGGALIFGSAAPALAKPKEEPPGKSGSPAAHQRARAASPTERNSDRGASPAGNNGHIRTSVSGCAVTVSFLGFDGGVNNVRVVGTAIPPTGDSILISDAFTASFPTRTQGNTLQATRSYTLVGIHHLKIVAFVTGPNGRTARKSKVEWVRCGAAVAAAAPTTSVVARPAGGSTFFAAATRATRLAGRPGASVQASSAQALGTTFERTEAARLALGTTDAQVLGTTFERAEAAPLARTGADLPLTVLAMVGLAMLLGGTPLTLVTRQVRS